MQSKGSDVVVVVEVRIADGEFRAAAAASVDF